MPASKTIKLNTGAEMPTVGLGTWKSQPGAVEKAVEHAIKFGYKHIDTATAYSNEAEVGQGIKASGAPRESLFITTKLNNIDHRDPQAALDYSLKQLGVGYLDLWLMHWPAPMTKDWKADKEHDWLDTWKAMEEVYKSNPDKVKAIGVSNFSIQYLERLLPEAKVVPAINQVELHPSCPQEELVAYCISKGISVTAYSPLGSDNSPLLKNPVVNKIATAHGVSPANILISLQANRPHVSVLPKSVTPKRVEENFTIVDLSEEEIAELHKIDETHHFRACNPEWAGHGHLGFPDRIGVESA
ncbi:Aldo keto reductase [Sistotremastrum niveocremeum HHB9708]|uniref:Aldo keto reductase n=2 Tax=Sistotremastraceae TaxID=3402574 RepID=A0A164N1G0_9AGAM|nr:Aldo keto reductase [Sistotremastrum niveocremeum HHB9708]KZT37465.1 Aldo/keto reductase [Sistotremastrum suecicum HHB10207 ss-3]